MPLNRPVLDSGTNVSPQSAALSTTLNQTTPQKINEWIARYYPDAPPDIMGTSEIQYLAKQAIANGWSGAAFEQRVLNSNIWKATFGPPGAPAPTNNGPGGGGRGGGGGGGGASSAQNIAAAAAAIKNQADTMGLELTPEQINGIATSVVTDNWGADQLTDYLTQGLNTANVRAGSFSGSVENIKKMAADQLLTISDATAKEYATRLLSSELDELGLKSLFQEQASIQYQWAVPQLTKGITMRNLMMPSRDQLASELELAPEAVDMMDPRWLGMMQVADDKGMTKMATGAELQRRARETDEFKVTSKARQMGAQAATMLREYMQGGV